MRFVLTDAEGAIVRVLDLPDRAHVLLNLPDGHDMYAMPEDSGLVDDRKLMVTAGALARRPGVTEAVQHDDVQMWPVAR